MSSAPQNAHQAHQFNMMHQAVQQRDYMKRVLRLQINAINNLFNNDWKYIEAYHDFINNGGPRSQTEFNKYLNNQIRDLQYRIRELDNMPVGGVDMKKKKKVTKRK